MISIKLIWIIIVGASIFGILAYLFYTEMLAMNHRGHHRSLAIHHSETFCDADDCDDYE